MIKRAVVDPAALNETFCRLVVIIVSEDSVGSYLVKSTNKLSIVETKTGLDTLTLSIAQNNCLVESPAL